jgi:regulatory protein
MNLLSRREHSEQELQRKLRTRGFDDSDIHTVIKALADEKLLSNSRFVESYIRSRANKGYGPIRIHGELINRGIPEDVIEHHLKMADNDWLIRAHIVWQKRFKGIQPADYKDRAAQMRFLHYRGFTSEHINKIFHYDTEHE